MSHLWLVTLPKKKDKANAAFTALAGEVQSEHCQVNRFDIPSLVVGTLDTLLGLSDDLTKISAQVENVVKKVERQYIEISGPEPKPLRVNETTIETFFRNFQWDFAQYQNQGKPLAELVAQVQGMAGKTEDELKMLATSFQEKTVALAAAKRRKAINLSTSDFEDFLRPEMLAKVDFLDTEHLLTVTVVVPKAIENEFLQTYDRIGSEIAGYGGPDWTKGQSSLGQADNKFGPALDRSKVKGSPVVPGSAKVLVEDGDLIMYAVTILRGQYQSGIYVDDVFTPGTFVDYLEPVKAAFREKRFIVRELVYDSTKAGGVDAAIDQATSELKQVRATTLRWCRAHFGEVYSGWVHLKIIQAFVESVLLYGLPAEFIAFFATVETKSEKDVKARLTRSVLNLRPELRPKKALAVEEEEEGENSESSWPFVCLRLPLIGVASSNT
eukprot:gene7204-7970_t